MRTTLTVDDDVMESLREVAQRRRLSLRRVVNETLRAGLQPASRLRARVPYVCPTYDMGAPLRGFDIDRAMQFAAQLEDEEIVRKLEQRK